MALTSKQVEAAKPGMHSDGNGLYLRVQDGGARSWIFRFQLNKKRREMGIGSYPAKTLADARKDAALLLFQVKNGIDPLDVRKASQVASAAEADPTGGVITFAQCCTAYVDSQAAGWKNPKHVQQWRNTLSTYFEKIASKPIATVCIDDIEAALCPIWLSKTETATRLLQRVGLVMLYASDKGWREQGDIEAWPLRLRRMLPKLPKKSTRVKHHPAMPYTDIPTFITDLKQSEAMGSKALLFAILNANRSGEVRLARWSEFDMASGVWVIPADRMKTEVEHRIPLSTKSIELLNALPRFEGDDLVFPGMIRGKPLSDMTLNAFLKRKGLPFVQHGFRSTFMDWAADCTPFLKEVRDMALAHAVADDVEAAYRRGTLFAKRKELMQAWADFCFS